MLNNQSKYPDKVFYKNIPKQEQAHQPGNEHEMTPLPIYEHPLYNQLSQKLKGKVAIITGGDSGIGRAVAVAYAKQGAKVVIVYYNEEKDAVITKERIESLGGECLLISIDLTNKDAAKQIVKQTIKSFKTINVLVNNAAYQDSQKSILDISDDQIEKTFKVNFFSHFSLIKEALPHLNAGDSIINTTSVTAYKGHDTLIDYSCTKGALTTLTRSLAINLADQAIRVNAVSPGPIWTPLIPSSMDGTTVSEFGSDTPLKRPGQPVELAGAYVFLASDDATYMTGQTIHVNGGEIING